MIAKISVEGEPIPQGSKSGFVRGGRVVLVEGKGKGTLRHKAWRAKVALEAKSWADENLDEPWNCACEARLVFYMTRPASKPKWKLYADVKPDLDKLCRSVFDSITKIIVFDDSRIVSVVAEKRYAIGREPGVEIEIQPLVENKTVPTDATLFVVDEEQ